MRCGTIRYRAVTVAAAVAVAVAVALAVAVAVAVAVPAAMAVAECRIQVVQSHCLQTSFTHPWLLCDLRRRFSKPFIYEETGDCFFVVVCFVFFGGFFFLLFSFVCFSVFFPSCSWFFSCSLCD
mgnify:CR=1 FL=1